MSYGKSNLKHITLNRDDLLLIGVPPILLIFSYFFLPPSLQVAFAAHYPTPNPITYFTSSYIHGSDQHLFQNIFLYVNAITLIHAICVKFEYQQWLRRTVSLLLTVLPVVISFSNIIIFNEFFEGINIIAYGFSGVAAGFVGFLFVLICNFFQKRYSLWTVLWTSQLILLASIGRFLIHHIDYSGIVMILLAFSSSTFLISSIGTYITWDFSWKEQRTWKWRLINVLFVVLPVGLLISLLTMLFPPTIGTIGDANVYAHGVGFLSGILISILTYW